MSRPEVAYLGPNGTFSHLVATKRFRLKKPVWHSCESIPGVCAYVAGKKRCRGVIPVSNSSGGDIYATVDALLDESLGLTVEEELAMRVSLALVGSPSEEVRRIYSHFAPYAHCRRWLEKKYPGHEHIEAPSTGVAIREAAQDSASVAIGSRLAARIYGMNVIKHPILPETETNVTHFFVITKGRRARQRVRKTSLAVRLINRPGSLYGFLGSFAKANVNLSRIISRPIYGEPKEVAFFIDADGDLTSKRNKWILDEAKQQTRVLRIIGAYSCRPEYSS